MAGSERQSTMFASRQPAMQNIILLHNAQKQKLNLLRKKQSILQNQ